jgi:uncharacterized protein
MRLLLKFGVVLLSFAVLVAPAIAVDSAVAGLPFLKKMQLAKAGDPDAKMAVAEAYETGLEAKIDLVKAAKWYREAALVGNLEAQFRLARLVNKGAPGLNADKATSLKLLQSAASSGHAASQNMLGLMLQNGDGVAKDEKAAASWYRKSADQKFATAETNLGVLYLKGLGVERSLPEAFKLFSSGAEHGDGWGMNNLGGMYEMGWGTAKDMAKAQEYYDKAATAGIVMAKQNLARLQVPVGAASSLPKP